MELKDFIADTIFQIVQGVADAQERISALDTNAVINPREVRRPDLKTTEPAPVEFDVALTVSEQETSKEGQSGAAKASVIAVFSAQGELHGEKADSSRSETVSRVRFTVMLAQPGEVSLREMKISKETLNLPGTRSGWQSR